MEKLNLEDLNICTKELQKYFWCELTFLKGLVSQALKGRAKEIKILLASSCSTGTAIHQLGDKPEYFYTEMMMLEAVS